MKKEFIKLKLKDIKPYPNNPRRNDAAVLDVIESIKQCENLDPIEVDENNIILSGHTRLKALEKLGYKETDCIRYSGLSEEQKKKYRLLANKTGEKAEWDFDLLEGELADLDFGDYDFGFEIDLDEEPPEIIEDEPPEPPESPVAKTGDLWKLGGHYLICGDSTDPDVIKKLMNGEKADMLFTDPPYGVDYAGKNAFLNAISRGNCIQTDIEGDSLENAEKEKDELWTPALSNAREFSKEKCSYYISSPQGGELMMMMMAIRESGWLLKHTIIWNKNNHVLGRSDYNYKHEPILYGWNKQHNFYGKGKFKTSVWDIPKPQKSDLHPTMKPIELIAECLLNSTKEGDIVCDVFGGSGSTMIACEQTGRICYMCELDPHYCDVIIKRWENLTGKKAELIS